MAFASIIGTKVPFGDNFPNFLVPAAAEKLENFQLEGKSDLIFHNDRPITGETPAHLLDDDFTKPEYVFVRNNGLPPEKSVLDPKKWTLEITGESCLNPKIFTLDELKTKFKHYTYALTLECGGNGRGEVVPGTMGTQWGVGAVYCGRWTGVRLGDILKSCGIKDDAIYVGYYGVDIPLNGDTSKNPISRGVPISKAMSDETLVAFAYEGKDIPLMNGYPLRLVCGGYPASASGKWLKKISIRNKIHDGEKMMGSYQVPCHPVAPGSDAKGVDMCIIESMPIKSVITYPQNKIKISKNDKLEIRGKAWAGELEVSKVEISIDFGATWIKAKLEKPLNRLAWQKFVGEIKFKEEGYYEVWARATDNNGVSQPMVLGAWNPKGYLNNSCHRVAVFVS
ncbi:sulfite oxidase [Campylobacter sp. FMV-PI01]|uniref:Sulfite oxidase n=2 Tax=Campylobacter portucalensis TaxID=2608384 RepID=A0A6L5WHY7_9BACT|nr:sulfite oxidase [Campylobacter portucalensis]MSN96062.1 sulfite oxidase [Campylobacter portucalensis]